MTTGVPAGASLNSRDMSELKRRMQPCEAASPISRGSFVPWIPIGPEGRHYSCRVSGGGSVVLVDEAAEPVAAADFALGRSFSSFVRLGRPEFERAMRPLVVVVVDGDAQHAFEVAAVKDQQPVQTFRADGSDEALGGRVCLRGPHRCLHDLDLLAVDAARAPREPGVSGVTASDMCSCSAWFRKTRCSARIGLVTQRLASRT